MRKHILTLSAFTLIQLPIHAAWPDQDFYGFVEQRPETKVGTWVIGGRSIEATERTELDDDDGPLTVGSCVEVEFDDGEVEEIETEPDRKCNS